MWYSYRTVRTFAQPRNQLLQPPSSNSLRPKLAVSQPGDRYEQEASRISEQVMRDPQPRHDSSRTRSFALGPAALSSDYQVLAESGRPLDPEIRVFMEPRFGHNFSRVRVHDGPRADAAAASVGARAFTAGSDIVFRGGQFAPETHSGRSLLAHELAHVALGHTAQPRLYRDIDPHYPTESEQHEIEKLLSREPHADPTKDSGSAQDPSGQHVKQQRTSLTPEQRTNLALSLKDAYLSTVNRLAGPESGSIGNAPDKDESLQIFGKARDDIYKHFAAYARPVTITTDNTTTRLGRFKAHQVLVQIGIDPEDREAIDSFARTIATTDCLECIPKLTPLDEPSKQAVIDSLISFAKSDGGEALRRAALSVKGIHFPGNIRLKRAPREVLYHSAVHELIHELVHPAFHAAFGDEDNINEGFTEYFTREVAGELGDTYKASADAIDNVRKSMTGPFFLASIDGESAEESLRLAYFRGRLDLIGWKAITQQEKDAVKAAADPKNPDEGKEWDATTARAHAKVYEIEARAKQAASRNIVGVGLYFGKPTGGNTIAVRYARVIGQTEPYARGRLLLEGQLIGGPVQNPSKAGASVGFAAEYQEPYFYAQAGLRFVGTAVPGQDAAQLDATAFAGVGVRAWQTVRVGVEGFAVLPVVGDQGKGWGAALTIGVELK